MLASWIDLGVFIPAPMAQGMRSDFFLEGPFMPPRMKMDRDPLGGLADMFGQMPGDFEQNSGLVILENQFYILIVVEL